ncbi:biosynthetic-type acetolactate synthase large subunit [Mangrovivirga cuniculi]|uniref:Acetolactate synthase n=1 Tax=Mangrovivirga cuniculi TaxID=2715131 RepID=A0A4D7JQ18_9BACT|nr:biosynthetic-type acetolactate synthase large subunit [Mangrovivirga cuniculi]QCK16737.1 biosynthetic-type acetolactate synthase large subunit [Mangrovivirga cuniculi]
METATEISKPEKINQFEGTEISGAQAITLSLINEGIDTVFGYPGGAIMPVYDALYDFQDTFKHYLVRHEQGAVHAAQGFARVSGKPGVCLATSGPGATNLITGIADAQIDSTPIVCITGQVFAPLLGTDAFQETDVVGISMPVTKWNYQVTDASEIPEVIAKAFYIAKSGRPGPVLIDITKDAQVSKFIYEYKKCINIRSYQPKPVIKPKEVLAAASLINEAKKPYIVFGQGVILSDAQKELLSFAEKAQIPAASTLLGLSAFPPDHPLYVGYLGMHGNYGPNIKTNECDVLIAVGMRFDDRVTGDLTRYAKQAKVIHIEIDEAEIDKNVKTDVSIHADAKDALQALTEHVKSNTHSEWLQEFRECEEIEYEKIAKKEKFPESGQIKMAEVVEQLSNITEGNAVVVTDVGQHQMVTSRYYKFKSRRSNITSGGLGTMGFALPAAIGARLGEDDREVIAIIGDGGIQMSIQELGTIFQYNIPVKIVILNNNFLGMVRQWQQLFFDKRYSSTEMTNPDFIKIAEGYSIKGKKVTERKDLRESLEAMMAHEGPYLIEVEVEKEENVFPMIPTGESVSNILLG